MTKQIMKLEIPYNGTWRIIRDDSDKYNPYRIYRETNGHRKLIDKYGDIASCLHCITQQITGHIWYMSNETVDRIF